MTNADVRTTLRVIAVVIAIVAALDPAFPVVDASVPPVVLVKAAVTGIETVEPALGDAAGRPVVTRDVARGRLPCAADEDCVLVADGSMDVDWDQRMRPISMIKAAMASGPNVRIRSVFVSRGHVAAAGIARVELDGHGVTGARTEVRIFDDAAVLGAATHQWTNSESAVVDVPWWPIDSGARVLRIEAVPIDGESTRIDNQVDAGVAMAASRIPVLVFDARPSWHSTFVRRALEDDARFTVSYRGRLAPAVSAGTPNGRLDAATLDRVPLVIAGGPDALTAGDVALLERFVRVRGGTLILLPERRPSGESARLFDATWTEHLVAVPEAVGALHASELLLAANLSPVSTVLAAAGAGPAIVSAPAGAGRIIVSGAMDAWRFRDRDGGGFDRYWRSLAAEGAAAGEGLTLTLAAGVAEAGARTTFAIRDRRMQPAASSEASVVQRCGDGRALPVRVWPGGAMGEYTGELAGVEGGTCIVEAAVGDRQVRASLAVVDHAARGVERTLTKLERRVRASRGVVANAGDESAVAGALGDATPMTSRDVTAYPMRGAWWLLPFAACLSIEWWLRRRYGLR